MSWSFGLLLRTPVLILVSACVTTEGLDKDFIRNDDFPNSDYKEWNTVIEVDPETREASDPGRLPTTLLPERYAIWLVPHLDDGSFLLDGSVAVTFNATAAASNITLHAEDMEISDGSVSVVAEGGSAVAVDGWELDGSNRFLVVKLGERLSANQRYTLSLNYTGNLRDGMNGFYRSYYYQGDKKRWLAATQFQSTSARKAFPCFDEPGFKTKFQVNIARDSQRTSLSNMPVLETVYDSGLNLTWDRFEETPMPMATYLVAFLVSDFASVSSRDGRLRTWQRGDAVRQGNYSATFSPDVLAALEDLTGVDYFLPKLDQAAVPDFAAGAMENWGLVKYRERNLLFDEGSSTSSNKQRIAEVVAHELAHMWFGNLVTPAWWSYLWLSEGFATFFQYFAAAQVEPEMRLDEQFLLLQHHTALQTDAVLSTHSITKVVSSSELGTIISRIVYNKAASVIRMAQHFLTTSVFYAGLNRYLTERGNGTAVPGDLFAALQEAYSQQPEGERVDVVQVLDSWTSQPGYPVLTVTRDYATGSANISQKRFLLWSEEAVANGTDYKWWIPITYTTQRSINFTSTVPRTWLNGTDEWKVIASLGALRSQWVIFNLQETGFYRVNYDAENWRLLAGYLDSEYLDEIHVLNRAQLLDDALNLARAGQLDYSVALPLTRYLARETDYIAWYPALTALSFLDQRLRGLGEYPHHVFQTYVLKLLDPLYKSLGFEERQGDDHVTKLLRNLVLSWECNYGQRDCVSKSTELFDNFMNNATGSSVPPDLRSVVYCAGLRHGGEREWQFLMDRLASSRVATEEGLILTALGCTRNETLAHRYLAKTIESDSGIRAQDISSVVPAVLSQPSGVDFTISYLASFYTRIMQYNNNSTGSVSSLISQIANYVTTAEQLQKLKEVVANITDDIGSNSLLSSLQSAETNLQWLQTHGAAVSDWAKQQDYRLPTSIVPEYYHIVLRPNLDDGTFQFEGRVNITFVVTGNTDRITLHAHDLEIEEDTISVGVDVAAVTMDPVRQFLDIKLEQELVAGKRYQLYMSYKGYHREDLAGFYRSYYFKNGVKSWLASTQFSQTSARRAFPCFDEPGLKAKFKIVIGRTADRHSLSNMPLEFSENDEYKSIVWDHFQETPMPLSTYLVGFVVSDFLNVSSGNGFYRTWQRQDAVGQAAYSVGLAPRVMAALEGYTGLDYFLPKLDQVAVPDFFFGAMENWGLVTYRLARLVKARKKLGLLQNNLVVGGGSAEPAMPESQNGETLAPTVPEETGMAPSVAACASHIIDDSTNIMPGDDQGNDNLPPLVVVYEPPLPQTDPGLSMLNGRMLVDVRHFIVQCRLLERHRERALLVEEGVTPSSYKQAVATVMAHELAHMWFGNLVTPAWWEHTWLKEGFARFFEFFAAAEVERTWQLEEQFVPLQVQTALSSDALESAHPLSNHVDTPSSIREMFGTISYNKGASIIRMMEHFLTKETFSRGLRKYLSRHGNSTAVPDNLFAALQEQYDEDTQNGTQYGQYTSGRILPIFVKTIMDTWILQKGYPVITVTRSYTASTATVTQSRFLLRRDADSSDTRTYRWWVPLTYTTQASPNFTSTTADHWLTGLQVSSWTISLAASPAQWVLFNIQQTGFYRVNYDARNWALLSDYLRSEYYDEIHVLNRAQLLDDAFALARAGSLDYGTALRLSRYLAFETEYVPWAAALSAFSYIDRRMMGLGEYEHHVFKSYVLKLLENVYDSLGLEERSEDTHVTRLHRNLIASWACNYGVENCTDMTRSEFAKLMADPDNYTVNADLKTVIYCNGLRYGGEAEFNFLWDRYLTHNVNSEQVLILGVMGCTRNETLAHGFLRTSLSNESSVRQHDQSLVYSSVHNNFYGVDFTINFLRDNYQEIIHSNNSVNTISSVVSGIAGAIYSEEQLSKLKEVVANITDDIGNDTLLSSLQSAETNLQWLQTHGAAVSDWVKQQDYRLPTSIVPEYYHIVLRPNLDDGTFQFEGRVNITFVVTGNTDRITLHAHDLEIEEDTISVGVDVAAVTMDPVRQFLDIKLEEELVAGRRYQLYMSYKGYHREDMNGFYRTYYYKNGVKRWLASTQFQPTSARRAFPCFDEPGYKAKFKITIARTEDRHALSNMPLESSDYNEHDNVTWDHFQETPMPMSTYLVAFVVSDFSNLSSSDGFHSTWQRSDAVGQARYSVDFAAKALTALEDYTGVDYFLPKMDQVAVPDFSAGAMENWGLVTYRERMILLEEGVTPSNYRQSIATIITHEFTHMWFGNLVSPTWWEHSWLNEGFAQFFMFFTTAQIEPTWQIDYLFLVNQLHGALSVDSLESSHPLTTHVDTPSSISAIFSTIIYSKGASVIRMMEHFLTKDTFRRGLNRYLTQNANSTTVPDYLFSALQEQYDEDTQMETEAGLNTTHRNLPIFVKTIMDTWTLQKGYPVVTVTRNYAARTGTVTQSRFLLRRDADSSDTRTYRWWVPLTYTTQASPNFTSTTADHWLTGLQVSSWTISLAASPAQWVLFNIQQTGFYRVNYDARNWALLSDYLRSEYYDEIHVLNRAQLLDDAFALARAGSLDYGTALRLSRYLAFETEYVPWAAALSAFSYIDRRMMGLGEYEHHVFKLINSKILYYLSLSEVFRLIRENGDSNNSPIHVGSVIVLVCKTLKLRSILSAIHKEAISYVLKLLENVYDSLGLEERSEDTHVTRLHRNLIASWACNYGVKNCTDMARSEFAKLMADPDNYTINPDLKTVVYCNGLRYGGEAEFDFLWNRYLTHNVNTEQVLILEVMGCTRNETLAHRHLQRTISNDSYIRSQDMSTVYPSVYNNHYGVNYTIRFLNENYKEIIEFNNSTASLSSIVSGIAGAIYSEQQLDLLKEVVANITADIRSNTLLSSLQSAETNLQWLQTHGAAVSDWAKQQDYRLPTSIVPEYYHIVLRPNLDDGTFQFEGRVNITFVVTGNTDRITLHAHDLEIEEDTISVGVDVAAVTMDPVRQFLDIKLEQEMVAGRRYRLHMFYKGYHREDTNGFSRSYYYKNGTKRWLASTKFEPTHARRAFPCFDEPAMKAKFKMIIGRTADRHSLSNMPLESSEYDEYDDVVWDYFQETPMPMSTYLLAFVVSDFENMSSSDGFFSTWQRADATAQARYSVDVSPRIMSALEEYTGLNYFLPKMDQVAVPDFQSGAMENWGLVTYREIYLLYEDLVSRIVDKVNILTTITHEFAHMWFGNLVSPKWWSCIWLNEGFAQYFQYFAASKVEPSWRLDELFVLEQTHTALQYDSLESSHPMTLDVDTPTAIRAMFSTVSYNKGASIIRMMDHFLTSSTLQLALHRYLVNYGNASAEPDNLFEAIQQQYDEDVNREALAGLDTAHRNLPIFVKTIMDTWTLQKGYPVITVTRSYTATTATITQSRFLLRRDADSSDTRTYRWWVPLTYTTQASPNFTSTTADHWLTGLQVSSWTISLAASPAQWVLFNIQQTGFYRVNYDARNWALLSDYLRSEYYDEIHVLNRAQLLDDAFALARAGSLDYGTALRLSRYLAFETEYVPWAAALSAFSYIDRRMMGLGEYEHHVFKEYVLGLMENVYSELGFEELAFDDYTTRLLRSAILGWQCSYGVKTCTERARSEFAAFMSNPNTHHIPPDLKLVVYCNALRYGGEEEFNFLWDRFVTHNVNTEQILILRVLGCTRNETLAHRFIRNTIKNDSFIRAHDMTRVYPSVYDNPYGVDFAINFLSKNYQEILAFNNDQSSALATVISGIAGSIYSQEQLNKLKEVVANITADIGSNTLLSSLQSAETNLQWLQTHGAAVSDWVKQQDYRLPTSIVPEYYHIVLRPNLDDGTFQFEGRVNITFVVTGNTDRITLHAHDLEIEEDTISVGVGVAAVTMDPVRQFLDIKLEQELVAGKRYRLHMFYKGYHREDMNGFYRTYYYKNGVKRWLASTQFQTTSARRAFPCFDEPGLKAKFKIIIGRTADRHALSNMPLESSLHDEYDDVVWDHFQETPMPMSTYLVAFVVSDFSNLSSSDGFYKTWQRSGATEQARYSIDVSPSIMAALEDYTGVDYFLPKMDQVAVPDFSAGAMENWGLVTYRERMILLQEGVSTSSVRQTIATVIAHEFAHMWFGNLVSPKWWSYTWLNEGFARYFEFFAAHWVENTWDLDDQFVVRQVHTALSTDSSGTAHSLTVDVGSPSSISSIFSTITYNKGASVIRMMEHFMTHETFRRGLNQYLTTFGNGTADPSGLFSILDEEYLGDFPDRAVSVGEVMNTWTLQSGYPLVTVTRNYTTGAVTVTQEQFLLQRSSDTADVSSRKWWVPLTYTSRLEADFSDTTTRAWMAPSQANISVTDLVARSGDWVIFNLQEIGFYRVNYDSRNWELIAQHLDSDGYEDVHLLNRAQLIDDAFSLARAGVVGYPVALSLTRYLAREVDYVPWMSALSAFNFLDRRLRGRSQYDHEALKSYVLRLMEKVYQAVGLREMPSDGHPARLHRNQILTWACRYGERGCLSMAASHFSLLMADPDNYLVPPDLKSVVYCNALRHGGEEEFNFLWNRYLTHNVNSEQILILGLMGCTRNETLAHRFLRLLITEDNGIRSQDISSITSSVVNNHYGVDFAISYLNNSFRDIIQFGNSTNGVTSLISSISGAISSEEQLNKLRQFINANSAELGVGATTAAQNSVASAERNLRWLSAHGDTVVDWLKQQDYRLPTAVVPESYVIHLVPQLDSGDFTFAGRVQVTVRAEEATSRVVLHVDDILVNETSVAVVTEGVDGAPVAVADQLRDPLRHFYVVFLSEELVVGRKYVVSMEYQGFLRDDMYGFYRSSYRRGNETRWLASTHFQATQARRAFPCFDEPALKATFQINVARTADRHTLSNMPVERVEEDSELGLTWDRFERTPMPMSTYLVALVVSDFENETAAGGFFRTWQREAVKAQARYSVEVSPSIMAALESYTGLDYFLPKLDQVAVPDFRAGAMENWGLVTYREQNILFVDGVTPSSYKQSITNVIAHEFAHKWFGNLVSPAWWSYLWLNEGFARYFQYFTSAEVNPSWRLDEQFVTAVHQAALSSDSLASTHALSADVGSPSEIRTLFSTVSYSKGAAVIRMTQHFLSDETFQQGLQDYLKNQGNSSASPDHLFRALHGRYNASVEFPEVDVKDVLDSWSLQKGYPLITVTRNYNYRSATVTQARFFLWSDERSDDVETYRWWVPLTFTSRSAAGFNSTATRVWLRGTQTRSMISDIGAEAGEWLIFNIQQTGFYRVNYDLANWKLITEQLSGDRWDVVPPVSRAQLLDDGLNLARAGVLDYEAALNLTTYLSRETDYVPWYSALTAFTFLDARLRGLGVTEHGYFKSYVTELLRKVYASVGLEANGTDGHVTRLHRNQVLTWLCYYEDPACALMARSELQKLIRSPETYNVDPDLRSVVYCHGLRQGGEPEWNFLWDRFLSYDVSSEQALILRALGCTSNQTLANRYLRKTITTDAGIRSQDLSTIFPAVYGNYWGVDFAIEFVKENYEEIIAFNNNTSSVISLVSGIASAVSTQAQLNQLRQLLAELGRGTDSSTLRSAERNLAWLSTHGPAVSAWLKRRWYRLPSDLRPVRYVLALAPRLEENFTFAGRAEVTLNATRPTSSVTLHANDLLVSSVRVQSAEGGGDLEVLQYTLEPARHFLVIFLAEELSVGQLYTVSVNYTGHLRDDMYGFYRSYYSRNGEKRWLATTQFQPTSARRAFPCLDEPGFKATFKISIARSADRHALSNMPVANSEYDDTLDLVWDHFEETPMPMSTYLVAFVVSDFSNLSSSDDFYKTWQRSDATEQARYSIDVSPSIMAALEDYTGVDYFLPKMDQVAVPDFSAGAMENWGLVTYRERYILHVDGVSSTESKQRTADIISHEFAHQWFGNLVSPKWWGDTWLNEGFGRYFQYFTPAQVEPSWRYDEQFVVRQLHAALVSDSLRTSHPMSHEASSPSEVSAMFSTISYAKGASVIRMAKHFLGESAFRNGLRRYLVTHGNGTTEPDYLFAALQAEYSGSDVNVKTVLDSWVHQVGYPLVTVTRNYTSGRLTVTQERFISDGSASSDYSVWWVPLTYTTRSEADFSDTATKFWLTSSVPSIEVANFTASSDWVLFNVQQTGFYRVNYDDTNWGLLARQLGSDGGLAAVHPVNRAQLLDDAFALARAGVLDYPVALALTKYLARETDYVPWYAALGALSHLDARLQGAREHEYHIFKTYVMGLLRRVVDEVGFEARPTDGHVTKLLRGLVMKWACKLGDQNCVGNATRQLVGHMSDPANNKIDPDVAGAVYCTGLRLGGEAEWDFLWQKYLASGVSTEQVLLLEGLGCTGVQGLAHRYLNLTITAESSIRQQDISLVTSSVLSNPAGVDFAISYLTLHFQDMADYNNGSYNTVLRLISSISAALHSQDQHNKLREFVESYQDLLGTSASTALSSAEGNLRWLSTHGPTVVSWLQEQGYRLPTSLRPESYVIRLAPDLDAFTFAGEVTVTLAVVEATDRVVLHANDLSVDRGSIGLASLSGGAGAGVVDVVEDSRRHFLIVRLNRSLVAGERHDLSISYTGHMRDDMYGFYRSYYYLNGQRRWIGSTQFQPTHARRAFPCFDEPAFKAKFNFSISVPTGYHALFNTKSLGSGESETSADGRRWERFEQTPVMSTYLVAFVVSDFVERSNAAGNVSVWQRADAARQAQYAVNVTQPIVSAMERLVGHGYQLGKLDQAAIPDFSAGAMENWGLITYRERQILWDEEVSTTADKRSISTVISHEVAHMWFGNAVTLLWWSYTWLNEGFATYFQTFATTLVETDWRLDEQFVILHHQAALASDARETSRPMIYDVSTPSQIASVFDFVSYAKAASVIRMMEHFLTRDVFLKGLHNYLGTHAYGNTEPDDLYSALQNASNSTEVSVKTVMDTWTTQMGYPLVTVTRDYSTGVVTVEQEHFLLRRSSSLADGHDYKWWIPLSCTNRTIANFADTAPITWLPADRSQISVSGVAAPGDWLIFNLQETGYYRVNYDLANWKLITEQLSGDRWDVVPPVSRAQLLDDGLNLARAGVLDYEAALNLTTYLSRETDYVPWYSVLAAFTFLDARLRGAADQDYQLFTNYVLRLIESSYSSLGFAEGPDDHHTAKLLRALVLSWACDLGLESCVSWARQQLALQMGNASHTILPDVSRVAYCTALRHGGVDEWNHLWRRYEASNSGTEQVLLIGVLGCTTNEAIINRYLSRSISENSGIRRQDAASVFSAVYSNPGGLDIAFNFLMNNYKSISEFYGGMNSIGNILTGIAAQLSTREQADALKRFVEANGEDLGTALDSSRRALESVEENLAWLATHGEDIFSWLRHEESLSTTTTTTSTTTTTPTTTSTTISTTTATSTTTSTTTATTSPATAPTAPSTAAPSAGSRVMVSRVLLSIPFAAALIRLAAL